MRALARLQASCRHRVGTNRSTVSGAGLLLLSFVLTSSVSAQPSLSCGLVDQPAATVFLPYFEVDLTSPQGRNTLFSIGNVSPSDTLAHAVIWTNWGHPIYSFDFFVPAHGVMSFDVRALLNGRLPQTSPPGALPVDRYQSCGAVLSAPSLDPGKLKDLLTGRVASDGLCYSSSQTEAGLATGYITVDSVHDCSGSVVVTPDEPDYFGDCATGLATNDNVLWGDFFLVDSSNDFAQGERLVALVADQDRFGDPDLCVDPPCSGSRITDSFYAAESNRMPLPSAYEARFLKGGGFDGGTELIVWSKGATEARSCDTSAPEPSQRVTASFRSEAGVHLAD